MSQQHPYQVSAPANNEPMQQSLFPSWHDRRHSHTSDAILEEGERKSGSFNKLKDIVTEKQKQEDEQEKDDDKAIPNITISKGTSDKIKFIVKDTTSYPPASVLNNSELTKKDEPEKPVRRSRSVRFNDDNESQFIKTSD